MDSEVDNNFYVTLPSNSSAEYFPQNTQSSFRTKLSHPLVLNGEWDVGLSEVFIPRSWFNVNHHNNSYSLIFKTEEWVKTEFPKFKIEWDYDDSLDIFRLCETINNVIGNVVDDKTAVVFTPFERDGRIAIELKDGYEIEIKVEGGRKLLYMLHLQIRDKIINKTVNYKYRPSDEYPFKIYFYIYNKNPSDRVRNDHVIPLTAIQGGDMPLNTVDDLINILHHNLNLIGLQNYARFNFDPAKKELTATVAEMCEIILDKNDSPNLLKKLNLNDSAIIKGTQKFTINPTIIFEQGELFKLGIYEYYEFLEVHEQRENLKINVGMYQTSNELFDAIKHIKFRQLPDLKVVMSIPIGSRLLLSKGLADMLGFEEVEFLAGVYTGKYPLELDGGITEIFIYSDVVQSHHVGDSFSPLLRIIPCMTEKYEQIVNSYQRPLYFPVRKNYIETIEIELRTSSGNNIVFSGGKTYVILSFRRRKL